MQFKFSLATAAAALALGLATAVPAQGDVVRQRQEAMKVIGGQFDIAAAMVKGQQPFDAAKVDGVFRVLKEKSAGYAALFPAGSNAGDSKATPAVWRDPAAFAAAVASFQKLVAENAPKAATAQGFKAAFTAVADGCRSCHQTYKTR